MRLSIERTRFTVQTNGTNGCGVAWRHIRNAMCHVTDDKEK